MQSSKPIMIVFSFVVMSIAASRQAQAGNCPAVTFANSDCSVLGGTLDVCTYDSSTHDYTCDLSGSGAGASATVVDDFPGDGGTHFEAWGTYWSVGFGDEIWCCDSQAYNVVDDLIIMGSSYTDTLGFRDGATATYAVRSATVSATILGDIGDDVIRGSDSTTAGYQEYRYGGDGADLITCDAGNDDAYGEGGDDTIYGATGADYLDGGDGADTIYGGSGADYLLGGSGAGDDVDSMEGGADNDTLDGGPKGDILCDTGGGTNDLFIDGDAVSELTGDRLWDSTAGTGTAQCNLGSGSVNTRLRSGMIDSYTTCGGPVLTSAPACP